MARRCGKGLCNRRGRGRPKGVKGGGWGGEKAGKAFGGWARGARRCDRRYCCRRPGAVRLRRQQVAVAPTASTTKLEAVPLYLASISR